jgi:CRP-like cAMP-binding protein
MTEQDTFFDPIAFLSTVGAGREMMSFRKGESIYAQDDVSDAVFVIQTGSVRLSARGQHGKEATLDILGNEDFVGKDSLAGQPVRTASASALTGCRLLRIEQKVMTLALAHEVTLGNHVLCLCAEAEHSIPAGLSGPTLQSQREKTSAYSPTVHPF